MVRKLSEAEIKGLKNLMKGAPFDKAKAEQMLLERTPEDFPEDVLDPWVKSRSKFDRERLLRVIETWGRTLDYYIKD